MKSKAKILEKHIKNTDENKDNYNNNNNNNNNNDDQNTCNNDVEEQLGLMRQECRRQLKSITYQEVIWYRPCIVESSTFSKAYGVIDSGTLYLYRNKEDYESSYSHTDDFLIKPMKLMRYELETNKDTQQKHHVEYSSVRSSMREILFGTSALTLAV